MEVKRLRQLARDSRKSLVNFLRDMVRIPSLSGGENKVALRV
ncbi:MAG: YgeY family selenium metabolism-linked hydrolase, partial [Elusimicrobia bacterium]